MSFTNAQLAQKISDLIDYWSSFNTEYSDWLGGTVDGGPGSDGKYPLTNWAGTESLIDSPAKLADNVSGYVGLAAASETAAAASAAAAATSESNASTSASTATTQAGLADADRVAAELAETNATNAQVTAVAQANLATDRAGYASEWANAAFQTLVSSAAGGDQVDDYSALHWATVAEGFAGSIDSNLYGQLAQAETVTGQWSFEADLHINSGNELRLYNTVETTYLRALNTGTGVTFDWATGGLSTAQFLGASYWTFNRQANGATEFRIGEVGVARGGSQSSKVLMYGEYVGVLKHAMFENRANAFRIAGSGANPVATIELELPTNVTGALAATGAVTGSNLNVANWDTAYGWGDHAGLYAPIAGYNNTNWDTAYGWGDHSVAGYQASGAYPVFSTTTQADTYLYLNRNSSSPAMHVATVGAGPSGKFGAVPTLGSTAYTDYVELGQVGNHIIMSGPAPKLKWIETDATANNGWWDSVAAAEQLRFRLLADADASSKDWLTVDRTGAASPVMTFGGQVTINGFVDNDVMLYFGMDRPWQFLSKAEDASNQLELQSINSKSFIISDGSGTVKFNFKTNTGQLECETVNAIGGAMIIKNAADAYLQIDADTDNVTETDNAYIQLLQDGQAVEAIYGFSGAANIDAKGNVFTGAISNGMNLHHRLAAGNIGFGVNGVCAVRINSSNDLILDNDFYPGGDIFMPGTGSGKLTTTTTAGSIRISNGTQWADIGPRNSSYCHMDTNGSSGFYSYQDFTIVGSKDIAKASHGNYLYHQGTYNASQAGGVTFSTGTRTGGVSGDIWFKYT
jgi:hypothetical protein